MKKKKYIILITVLVIIVTVAAVVIVYRIRNSNNKPPVATEIQTSQTSTVPQDSNEDSQPNTATTSSQSNTTSAQPAAPKAPTFTKSSGNNGPVPIGVNIGFTCAADPGVDCSIILDAGGKQTVLGPTKVVDNGRGQYFALFYWTSVKGSYDITAQAKNVQGGISTSEKQTLVVK